MPTNFWKLQTLSISRPLKLATMRAQKKNLVISWEWRVLWLPCNAKNNPGNKKQNLLPASSGKKENRIKRQSKSYKRKWATWKWKYKWIARAQMPWTEASTSAWKWMNTTPNSSKFSKNKTLSWWTKTKDWQKCVKNTKVNTKKWKKTSKSPKPTAYSCEMISCLLNLIRYVWKFCFYFINWFMRTELYKFQTRQQKIEREDSATRPQELSKVSSYTPGHWKSYIPHEISLSSEKRSQRVPSYYNYRNGEPNYDTAEEDSRVRSILSVRKEEERKRQ